MGDHGGTQEIEYDDFSMKTKLILNQFSETFETLRFDENSFLNTLIDFIPYWDYWPTNAIHADRPGVYTIDKTLNLSTIDKTHLKCDVIVENGLQGPIFLFVLNKLAGYKVFCEPETTY